MCKHSYRYASSDRHKMCDQYKRASMQYLFTCVMHKLTDQSVCDESCGLLWRCWVSVDSDRDKTGHEACIIVTQACTRVCVCVCDRDTAPGRNQYTKVEHTLCQTVNLLHRLLEKQKQKWSKTFYWSVGWLPLCKPPVHPPSFSGSG
jgi:hypothetical protein